MVTMLAAILLPIVTTSINATPNAAGLSMPRETKTQAKSLALGTLGYIILASRLRMLPLLFAINILGKNPTARIRLVAKKRFHPRADFTQHAPTKLGLPQPNLRRALTHITKQKIDDRTPPRKNQTSSRQS